MPTTLSARLSKIPRNLFQTWMTKDMTPTLQLLISSWKQHHPHYTYCLFDDADCEQFIRTHFDEKVWNAYQNIIPGAFKADLWRYCVLYVYGGVYVDVDTICISSIDQFLNETIEFMTPVDLNNHPDYGTYNLFNCFIASVPKHPILWDCIQQIVHHVEQNIVPFSNLDFSGPGVLGQATNRFLGLPATTSFVGKEGLVGGNIKLLQFVQGREYVFDPFQKTMLFQNKNGNSVIQHIYRQEIQHYRKTGILQDQYVDWGTCTNPIKQQPQAKHVTIVSMFYKIREKEQNQSNSVLNHSVERYLNMAKKFILKLDYQLVLFTDCKEVMEFVAKEKQNHLTIYDLPFEQTYYYQHHDRLVELQRTFQIHNGNLDHETPMYIILNNDKFYFMEQAIERNPYHSTHFVWMDFGINHVALNPERIHDWMPQIPDKIRQMCINPFTENIAHKTMFANIYHHMAGGLFSGSKESMLKYCELFKKKTEQIYSEDWYQIDEAVMTMVQRENPELFSLYYGDYAGIISNYKSPIHNIDLIMRGISKNLSANRNKEAWEALCFCADYFLHHLHDGYLYDYIRFKIITDYYNHRRTFTPDFIELVQKVKSIQQNNALQDLLVHNLQNIHFYENKQELLCLID